MILLITEMKNVHSAGENVMRTAKKVILFILIHHNVTILLKSNQYK